jgi:hypothetical protein
VLMDDVPENVAAVVVVKANAVPEIEPEVTVNVLADTAASRVTLVLITRSGTFRAVAGVQLMVPVPVSSRVTDPDPAPVATEAAAVGAMETVPAAAPLRAPVEMDPPAVMRLRVEAVAVVTLCKVMAAVPVLMLQVPDTVNTPEVVSARLLPIKEPAQFTVVREVSVTVKVTGPLTVSAPAHERTGLQVGVPAPPMFSAAPFVNSPVTTFAAPEGATRITATNEAPFTGPVDTAPVEVVRERVPDAENTTLWSVMAAEPVSIAQVPEAVTAPEVVRARLALVRLPPLFKMRVVNEVRGVAKITAVFTVRGAFHNTTGVQVAEPPALLNVRVAPAVNKPVDTATAPLGAITTDPANELPLTAPVDTAPELVASVTVPAALNAALANVIPAVPVLTEQTPEKVATPVVVRLEEALVREAAVIERVVTDTAACRVTPAELVMVSGTPSAEAGVQVMAPEPASAKATLPEPAPVATEAAEVGEMDTVPAAEPLRAPVEIAPPAVIRVRVTGAVVTTPPRVIGAVPVLMEQAPATVNGPVVMPRLELVRLAELQVTATKEVSAAANVAGPFTVRGALQPAAGVQAGVPPPPLRVKETPFVNKPVDTAAAPLGAITILATNAPPLTAPIVMAPLLELKVSVPLAAKTAGPNVVLAILRAKK